MENIAQAWIAKVKGMPMMVRESVPPLLQPLPGSYLRGRYLLLSTDRSSEASIYTHILSPPVLPIGERKEERRDGR